MTEQTRRLLNPTEAIVNAMPAIIEGFVTFYGEEEREDITNKFQNMVVVGYSKPTHISSIIHKSNDEISNKLIASFLDKVTQDQEERKKLSQLLFASYSFEYSNLQPINKYMVYCNGQNRSDYNKQQVVAFLQQMYSDVTMDNMDELMQAGTFRRIEQFFPLYEQAIEEYKEYFKEMGSYVAYVDGCNSLELALKKKYSKKQIEELKDLFTESEYKQIQDEFESVYFSSIHSVNGKTKNYTGYTLDGLPLIEAFDSKNEQLLENGSKWQKESIKRDRIRYFRNFGLDLGDDYSAYLDNPRAKELTPSKELIERILTVTKKMQTEMKNEFYSSISDYQKNRARIDSLGLLDKEDLYDASAYEKESTFVSTNIKQIDGKYIEYPILCLYVSSNGDYLDHSLIHELNHVYELKLQSVRGENYQMVCGWDILDGKIYNQKGEIVSLEAEREKRDYELFSEITNELISQEISEILSKQGVYIFNTQEDKKIKNGTSYEYTKFLIQTFYETYKKEIIASRKNGDMSLLFDKVGKENFEALNQLFHEYLENFNDSSVLKAYKDLNSGIDSEGARKLKELAAKRTRILEQMQEYSRKATVSL